MCVCGAGGEIFCAADLSRNISFARHTFEQLEINLNFFNLSNSISKGR